MNTVLMGLAFSAGIMAFFSPCNFPLLPAYISYFICENDEEESANSECDPGNFTYLGDSIKMALIAISGFFTVFITFGLISSVIGSLLTKYFPYLAIFVGFILIGLGILLLIDRKLSITPPAWMKFNISGPFRYYLFGIAYSMASLACVFPVFLMVVFTTMSSDGLASGIWAFILYASGMSVMLIIATVAIAMSKNEFINRFKSILPYINRISGIVIIIAGIILIRQEIFLRL